jgi:hypothetical protein
MSARPPPPHDPVERVVAVQLGEWEVRVFEGARQRYFLPRGMGHVQLWHARAGVSVLTPSKLTAGLYEVFPVAGWKARANSHHAMAMMVLGAHGLYVPSPPELAEAEHALVFRLQHAQTALVS